MPSGSSSLTLAGVKGDNSLLNEGFLQAKPEKLVMSQKPRSHLPTAPAPVSAVRNVAPPLGTWLCRLAHLGTFAQAIASAWIPNQLRISVLMPFPPGTLLLEAPSAKALLWQGSHL